jgi:hypothetical protein
VYACGLATACIIVDVESGGEGIHMKTMWMAAALAGLGLGLLGGCVVGQGGTDDDPSVAVTAEALSSTSYSGRALVLGAKVLGIVTGVADTGPLPSAGGVKEVSLVTANVPGLLSADALEAFTLGQNEHTISQARAANVNLGLSVGNITIGANLLASTAMAACSNNAPSLSGSSVVAALSINGKSIVVTGAPNQTVNLLLGKVIINERSSTQSGSTGSIHVSAIHVVVAGLADVLISSADAGITCSPPPPLPACTPQDYVTGQGYITSTPSGRHGNYSLYGEIVSGAPTGHVNYDDDGSSEHVKSTDVTSYTVTGATSRRIQGHATILNKAGIFTYTVDVTDNGGGGDLFSISVSDGYHANGVVASGTIDLFVNVCQ